MDVADGDTKDRYMSKRRLERVKNRDAMVVTLWKVVVVVVVVCCLLLLLTKGKGGGVGVTFVSPFSHMVLRCLSSHSIHHCHSQCIVVDELEYAPLFLV